MKTYNFTITAFFLLLISSISLFNEPVFTLFNIPINLYRIYFLTLVYIIMLIALFKKRNIKFLLLFSILLLTLIILQRYFLGEYGERVLSYYISGPLIFYCFSNMNNNIKTLDKIWKIIIVFALINLTIGLLEYINQIDYFGDKLLRYDGLLFNPVLSGIRVDGLFKTPELFILFADLLVVGTLTIKKRIDLSLLVIIIISNAICYFNLNILILLLLFLFSSKYLTNFKLTSARNKNITYIIILAFLVSFIILISTNDYLLFKAKGSFFARIGGYANTISAIADSPFIGVKNYHAAIADRIEIYDVLSTKTAHNGLLEMLVDGGIFLGICILIFWIYIYLKLKEKRNILLVFIFFYVLLFGGIFGIFSLYSFNDVLYSLLACLNVITRKQ